MTDASPEEVIERVIRRWIPTQARVATNTIIFDLKAAGYAIAPKVATEKMLDYAAAAQFSYSPTTKQMLAGLYAAMIAASQQEKE